MALAVTMNGDVHALALARFEGASAMIEGSARILILSTAPRCSRWHMCRAASSGGSDAICDMRGGVGVACAAECRRVGSAEFDGSLAIGRWGESCDGP